MALFSLCFLSVLCASAQETYIPGEYLPVYPGSTWTYITDKGDTVVDSTESTYRLYSPGFLHLESSDSISAGFKFVPFYHTAYLGFRASNPVPGVPPFTAVFGYGIQISNTQGRYYGLSPLLDTVKRADAWLFMGDSRTCQSSSRPPNWWDNTDCGVRYVLSADSSMEIGGVLYDSLLVMEYGSGYESGSPATYLEFYKKGIGLVRVEQKAWHKWDGPVVKSKSLVAYHVNSAAKRGQILWLKQFPFNQATSLEFPNEWGKPLGYVYPWNDAPEKTNKRYYLALYDAQQSAPVKLGGTLRYRGQDTLLFKIRASSGLPAKLELIQGEGSALSDSADSIWKVFRFTVPNETQVLRFRLSQSGDSAYGPAPALEGDFYLDRYLNFTADTLEDGRIRLVSAFEKGNQWYLRKTAQASPHDGKAIAGASGQTFMPEAVGTYYLGGPCGSVANCTYYSYQSFTLSTPVGVRPGLRAESSEPLRIRVFGVETVLGMDFKPGATPDLSLVDVQGSHVERLHPRFEGNHMTVDVGKPSPGLYLLKACETQKCRSVLLALP